jgi:hypothetical protein
LKDWFAILICHARRLRWREKNKKKFDYHYNVILEHHTHYCGTERLSGRSRQGSLSLTIDSHYAIYVPTNFFITILYLLKD